MLKIVDFYVQNNTNNTSGKALLIEGKLISECGGIVYEGKDEDAFYIQNLLLRDSNELIALYLGNNVPYPDGNPDEFLPARIFANYLTKNPVVRVPNLQVISLGTGANNEPAAQTTAAFDVLSAIDANTKSGNTLSAVMKPVLEFVAADAPAEQVWKKFGNDITYGSFVTSIGSTVKTFYRKYKIIPNVDPPYNWEFADDLWYDYDAKTETWFIIDKITGTAALKLPGIKTANIVLVIIAVFVFYFVVKSMNEA
jgi:hypothetical protein